MLEALSVFLICLTAGTVGGICGIGGGILIKPLLDALTGLSVSAVSFLSGVTVMVMAAINMLRSQKKQKLRLSCSLPLGIGAALGGIAGKELFSALRYTGFPERTVGALQSAVLAVLLLLTLLYFRNKDRLRTHRVRGVFRAALIGLALGLISSFLGIGGGPFHLAVLTFFFSMDAKEAAVNSLLVILISQLAGLCVALVAHTVPSFPRMYLALMIAAGIISGVLASHCRGKMSSAAVEKLLSGIILLTVGICLYNVKRMLF